MKINVRELASQLEKGIMPFYLVTGDEPLLVQESCDQIRAAARSAGYEERQVFQVDAQFNWQALAEETQSLSLFANQRRIEVHLSSGKPGQGRDFLEGFLQQPPDDVVLLVSGPRLDAGEFRRNWYKGIQGRGLHVQVWPVDAREFPQWLEQRCRAAGLKITRDALRILVERLEGNLLAATQELERLRLIADGEHVDERTVEDSVLDSSRHNAFELSAEACRGQRAHALRMLAGLRQEGTAPLQILAILHRDLKHINALQRAWRGGEQSRDYFRNHGIRQRQQQQSLESAARRLSSADCTAAREQALLADRATKGYDTTAPAWNRLEALIECMTRPSRQT